MKLYFSKGACSLAVRIIINELELPCEFEAVDLKTKKTATGEDFLKINPKGSVPTLIVDNHVLTENAVIQQYLADKIKAVHLLPPISSLQRYRVLEWLNYISSDIHKGCGPLFNPNIPEETKELFRNLLKTKLALIDKHLADHTYLAGTEFTLPDGYLYVVLTWSNSLKLDLAAFPNLTRYFKLLSERKSIVKSRKDEGLN